MSYCRYCGKEIVYKRTKNERWMPCDASTGEPHFCQNDKNKPESGLITCSRCGKPLFIKKTRGIKIFIDYSTLKTHKCSKADITRYMKYLEKKTNEK